MIRRALVGLFCGAACSLFLFSAVRSVGLALCVGSLVGIVQIFAFFDLEGGSAIDRGTAAAALGVPLWVTINVILLPIIGGRKPQWTAEEMRALSPALVGWLLFSFLLGTLTQVARQISKQLLGPELPRRVLLPPTRKIEIVILGGGFAGVTTAEQLEKQFRDDPTVVFTLVSETNSWLFTPMLVEVAASGLEPTHITTPLRTSLKRTRVLRSKVAGIDLEARRVQLNAAGGQTWLRYDHLVVALGAVSSYPRSSAIGETPREFKTLSDAMGIRNHVIDMFERADAELDPGRLRALPMTIMPLWQGRSLDWSYQHGQELYGSLVGHIVYGLIVGVIYAAVDRLWFALFIESDPINRQREAPGSRSLRCIGWVALVRNSEYNIGIYQLSAPAGGCFTKRAWTMRAISHS
jgi:NADH:ubiquinone reductase (H+-translocating)